MAPDLPAGACARCDTPCVTYEVDAATMCDALSDVPGVEHVVLEFDQQGNGVLRVQVAGDQDHGAVVGAAVRQMRHRFGLGVDHERLRLTGPAGRPVVAVVETLDAEQCGGSEQRGDDEIAAALADAFDEALAADVPPDDVPVDVPADDAPTPEALAPARSPQPRPRPGQTRVVVERVVVTTEHQQVHASVQLRSGEYLHEGSATRPATGPGAHRALAADTAGAVEAVVASSARLEVDQVDLLQVGPDHVAVVVLTLLNGSGIDRLTGSALVRSDARDAVVRATLDALNRRAGLSVGR
jgi:hypothetical protein